MRFWCGDRRVLPAQQSGRPLNLLRRPSDVTLDGNEEYTEVEMVPYVEDDAQTGRPQ